MQKRGKGMRNTAMKKSAGNDAPVLDRALVEKARTGDRDAFSELYALTSPQLYRTIHAMVRDDDLAWDIQQDTYLRAWTSLEKLRDPEALMPWLRRIAVNVAVTELTRQKALRFSDLRGEDGREPELPDPREEHQPELALDRKEVSRQVRKIVGGLSREQQLVVSLFYFEGLSIKEIAELLQVTPGTVKTQLHRGRKGVEKEVLALKKRGVSLCGLAPLSYLTALLRRLEPEPAQSQRTLKLVLEQAPVSAATITAVTAGRALFHSVWTNLLAALLAVSLLVGGKFAYDALRPNPDRAMGDYRPPASETAAPEEESRAPAVRRQPLPADPAGPDSELKGPLRRIALSDPGRQTPPEPSEAPPEPSEAPPEPSQAPAPEPSAEPPNVPAPNNQRPEDPNPAPPPSEPPAPSESEGPAPADPSASEETPDETEAPVPLIDRGSWGENLTWTLDENGLLTISGSGAMSPSLFQDDSEFHRHQDEIVSVSLPEGLTSIGDYAFTKCWNLTSVTIPEGVSSIGESAFEECYNLSSAVIPDSVVSIGNGAFQLCTSLTSLSLPKNLAEIGDFAFSHSGLRSVVLPDSLDSLGAYAFYQSELRSVTLPNHDTRIGGAAFTGCPNLSSILMDPANPYFYCDEAGVLFSRSRAELLFCPLSFAGSYTIPADVRTVRSHAFSGCTGLRSVTIPESVRVLESHAFFGCTGLTGLSMAEGLNSIGDICFSGCTGLRTVTIPDSVSEIGRQAFQDCDALTSITIPESVVSIGDRAFAYCNQLTICAAPDSYAEQYARANGIPFENIAQSD